MLYAEWDTVLEWCSPCAGKCPRGMTRARLCATAGAACGVEIGPGLALTNRPCVEVLAADCIAPLIYED
jgi:hypothetical protein